MRTISFIAFKGGSGKTTLAVNVAAALAGRHTVALIDLDPQGNATSAAPITHEGNTTVAEALLEASKNPRYFLTEESFSHVTFSDGSGFYLLPTPDADELSVAGERLAATPGGEHALARALSRLTVGATVIDTAPSISRLTANAVAASTAVFAPFTEQRWSMEGALEAMRYVEDARDFGISQARFGGAVLNRAKAKRNASNTVVHKIAKTSGLPILKSSIPERVSVQEAELVGVPAIIGSRGNIREAFEEVAAEIWRKSRP